MTSSAHKMENHESTVGEGDICYKVQRTTPHLIAEITFSSTNEQKCSYGVFAGIFTVESLFSEPYILGLFNKDKYCYIYLQYLQKDEVAKSRDEMSRNEREKC